MTPTDNPDAASADAASPDADQGAPPVEEGTPAHGIREALREVRDPELGVNIVDLGLIYDIEVDGPAARVTMTLTSPGCPAGGQILSGAQKAAESVDGVDEAEVNLVWKPFWTPDRIDPEIRASLGI